ncbi:hypothetical protein V502_00961 [Pseudogymnoascus sp. VKM F-4520 (FW-2644)]|nr:hypothetical protein V502_00961 [Pseudogymnoascus sp. VKM F-4520 (FW-2644)]
MPTASRHPKLTPEEVIQYYDRLHLPQEQRIFDVAPLSPESAFAHLAHLQRHHLAWVPFENLSIHYSRSRQISLHPEDLFKKIIQSPGRGGYCMENNALFAILLRTLGYRIRSCGARTHDGKVFGGWSHHVNLVTIGDEVFVTDVGYGPNNSVVPLSLQKDGEVVQGIHQETIRIIRTGVEGNEDAGQKVWVFQHRLDPNNTWRDCYCFTDLEFWPEDFEVMNLSTSQSPRRFFTQRAFCTKMILDEKGENIIGRLTLQTQIKRSVDGLSEVIREFTTEDDRLVALKEFFDIELSKSEASSILGTMAEIKAS